MALAFVGAYTELFRQRNFEPPPPQDEGKMFVLMHDIEEICLKMQVEKWVLNPPPPSSYPLYGATTYYFLKCELPSSYS